MKKLITLLAFVAMAVCAQAQSICSLLIDPYPWKHTFVPAADLGTTIIFTDQLGEYKIINANNVLSPSEYKGIRIEYQGFPETVDSERGVYVQVKIGDGIQYYGINPNGSSVTVNFNENVMELEEIDNIAIQGQAAGPAINIKKVYLITTDDTEEELTAFAGDGWGNYLIAAAGTITFTGQYGGCKVVDAYGGDVTFTPGDKTKTYTIELAEPAPNGFMVEFDGEEGGFNWFGFPAGTTKMELEVSDATCTQPLTAMYIKSNQEEGYPFDLTIASITVIEQSSGDEPDEDEDLALYITNNIWNANFEPSSISLTFSDVWGEYAIVNSNNAISTEEYKGIRVEYEGDLSTAVDQDGWLRYVQIKIGPGDGMQYVGLNPYASTAEANFQDDVLELETIENINIQGVIDGAKVKIKAFYLIKNDGTLEKLPLFGGPIWGCSFDNAMPSGKLTFTGQWGSVKIVDGEGNDITFEHKNGAQAYKYVMELEAPAGNDFMVEFADEEGGFNWLNFSAGETTYEFEISDHTCGQWSEEGFTPKNLANLFIKANTSENYPFDLLIKRIYRLPIDNPVTKLLGDVNGDGEVNVTDVMLTVNYVIGKNSDIFILENADVNEDTEVNVTDVMLIVSMILGN